MSLRVLLMVPTWPRSESTMRQLVGVTTVNEPLGLAYLASVLREEGHRVEILDGIAEDEMLGNLDQRLRGRSFDLIGMTVFTPSVKRARENMEVLRTLFPDSVIGIGGPHVNALFRIGETGRLFREFSQIDFAAYGEGEETILEIARETEGVRDFSGIKGIIWKKGGGQIINDPRPLISDLDKLPFPALDLLPLSRYRRTPSSCRYEPVRSILITRGCPFSCIFCDRSAFGSEVRRRSLGNVIEEIRVLVEDFGSRELRIWDDVFTLDRNFVLDFCMAIKPFNLPWTCNARVNTLDSDVAVKMRQAGCWAVDFGIESGNDRILKVINKKFTTADARRSFQTARDAGLEIRAFFILGLPEEDQSTLKDTIRFAVSNQIDYATFYLPQPYPGTELYERAVNENALITDDWSDFRIEGDRPTYVNPNFSPEELVRCQRYAYRRFYRNPGLFIRHLRRIRSWNDIRRYASGVAILRM